MGSNTALDGVRRTARNSIAAIDELLAALHEYKFLLMKELLGWGGASTDGIPEGWRAARLGELATMAEGPAGALASFRQSDDGLLVVSEESVATLRFVPGKCAHANPGMADADAVQVRGADIVMAARGERAGACAIMPVFSPGGLLGSGCIKIAVDTTAADPFFVCNVLHYLYRCGAFKSGEAGIDIEFLAGLPVMLPPPEAQKKIAESLLAVSGLIVKAEEVRAGAGAVCDSAAG